MGSNDSNNLEQYLDLFCCETGTVIEQNDTNESSSNLSEQLQRFTIENDSKHRRKHKLVLKIIFSNC